MDRDVTTAGPPWAHRLWCAPECDFPAEVGEGTHQGRAWTLTPADEQASQVGLRLYERVGEDTAGQVGVLVSVTERRLADDLDPFGEGSAAVGGGLADITSSAGLSAEEVDRLFVRLGVLRVEAAETQGQDRG